MNARLGWLLTLRGFGIVLLLGVGIVAGCNPTPTVQAGPVEAVLPVAEKGDYQAETSTAVIDPGEDPACPGGAIFVGYNSTAGGHADPWAAGLSFNRTPLNPATWQTLPKHGPGSLNDMAPALGGTSTVEEVSGDPSIVYLRNRHRLLYVMMLRLADPTVDFPQAFVAWTSDDCGSNWTASRIGPFPRLDDPSAHGWVDREALVVGTSTAHEVYASFLFSGVPSAIWSDDGGATWAPTSPFGTRPVPFPNGLPGITGTTNSLAMDSVSLGGGAHITKIVRVWPQLTGSSPQMLQYFSSVTFDRDMSPNSWTTPQAVGTLGPSELPFAIAPYSLTAASATGPRLDIVATLIAAGPEGSRRFVVATPYSSKGVLIGGPVEGILVFDSDDGVAWNGSESSLRTFQEHDNGFPILVSDDRGDDVVFARLDTRADPATPGERFSVFAEASVDRARSWGDQTPRDIRSAPPFLPFLQVGNYFGDYNSGAVFHPSGSPTRFYLAWADSSVPGTTRVHVNYVTVSP